MKKFGKLFILTAILTLMVGCGKIPTLTNGDEIIAKTNKGSVSANQLYEKLKVKNGTATMVDMIDTIIMDSMFKEQTDAEKDYIKEQIESMKSSAEQYKTTFSSMIKYYGFENEAELKDYLSLTYRRNEAVNKYVEKDLKEKNIKKYYEDNIYGDIKVKHILISAETTDEMTTEQKETAFANAKKEAQTIITKLNNKEDWDKLAKEKSGDTATADKGGSLGWISYDDDLEEAFIKAAFKLEKGKYTIAPIKTSYGYHIIYKVDEKNKPSYKDSKKEIIDILVKEALADDVTLYYNTLQKIRKDYDMDITDTDLAKLYKDYMKTAIANAKEQEKNAQAQ